MRSSPAILLGVALLLVAVLGVHFIGEPLDADITAYAVIGRELVHGRTLYDDLWDHKPPLIHGLFATAYVILGEGPVEIYALWVLFTCIVLVALWLSALELDGLSAALWTVGFFLPVSVATSLQANQPNTEVFQNAFLALGAMFLIRRGASAGVPPNRRLSPWFAGAAFAAATLVKPTAAVPALGIVLGWLLGGLLEGRPRDSVLGELHRIGLPVVGGWGAVCGYFAVRGRWNAFSNVVFGYNRAYAGDMLSNFRKGMTFHHVLPSWAVVLTLLLPAFVLGIAGLLVSVRNSGRWLLLGWITMVPVSISLTGRGFAHYYQLWIPPLVLGAGLFVGGKSPSRSGPLGMLLPTGRLAVGVVTLLALVLHVAPSFKLSPDEVAAKQYGRESVVIKNLSKKLVPGDSGTSSRVFAWGPTAGFYFYAHLRPPTGLLYYYPAFNGGPKSRALVRRTLRELSAHPPDLVVAKKWLLLQFWRVNAVSLWVVNHYYHSPDLPSAGGYVVMALREKPLHLIQVEPPPQLIPRGAWKNGGKPW